MVSSGMLQCVEEHTALALVLSERRDAVREIIVEALRRWLEPDRASSVARFLVVVLQGMSVQARDGATREDLEEVVQEASCVSARDNGAPARAAGSV